jgi:amidase
MAPLAIGTETSGSIISPSSQNGVCGLKPSLGLVSRSGIIPITSRMDTAGPMARNVADLALLLEILAGEDPQDPATGAVASMNSLAFTQFLDPDRLDGLQVGVVNLEKSNEFEKVILENAISILEALGAVTTRITIEPIPYREAFRAVLRHGMKHDLNRFLQGAGEDIPVHSLDEVIAFNRADLANRAPFGQDLLEASQAQALSQQEEATLFAEVRSTAQAALSQSEVLLSLRTSLSAWYSPAGWPALSLPGGLSPEGEPVGLTLVGRWGTDGQLLAVGHALEHRVNNDFG